MAAGVGRPEIVVSSADSEQDSNTTIPIGYVCRYVCVSTATFVTLNPPDRYAPLVIYLIYSQTMYLMINHGRNSHFLRVAEWACTGDLLPRFLLPPLQIAFGNL